MICVAHVNELGKYCHGIGKIDVYGKHSGSCTNINYIQSQLHVIHIYN